MNIPNELKFVRVLHGSDLYRNAVELRRRLLRLPLGLDFTQAELADETAHWHFAMYSHQQVVASVTVVPKQNGKLAKVRQMVVDDHCQGQGIGQRLMQRLEEYLKVNGVESVELNARLHAVPFYQRLGYQIEGEAFIEVTIEHYKMVKNLQIEEEK